MTTKKIRTPQPYSLMKGILGQRCWSVTFAYGGELHLHFGKRIPSRIRGQNRGSWILATCGTSWVINTPHGEIVSKNHTEDKLADQIKVLERRTVSNMGFDPFTGHLWLSFDDGYAFHLTPSAEDDKCDVPYWEIFTPDNMLIAVGPRDQWSYTRSDVVPRQGSRSTSRKRSVAARRKRSKAG